MPLRAWPGGQGGRNGPGMGAGDAPQRQLLDGKRILLVEDEAMLAFELQCVLEDAGAQVIGPALSLAEATAILASAPELEGAVLDVNLSGHSVFPVAQELAGAGVPILFNTGHADRAELTAAFPHAEVLFKPTRPESLVERLAALIARPQPN
jgi:DNA-binding response OmpR family regulator